MVTKFSKEHTNPKLPGRVPLTMTLTKFNIIKSISQNTDLDKIKSVDTLETLLEIIKFTFESGEDLMISGFGQFEVKDKKQRRSRNPETGNAMILGARRVVTFKCSNMLRERLNVKPHIT